MVSGLRKRVSLRRKLQILRSLTKTKSVKRTSIVVDALPHIYMLKLKLEAVHREYSHLMAIKTDYINLIKHRQVHEVSLPLSLSLSLSLYFIFINFVNIVYAWMGRK
ncbi:unnamed protein product [Malus baccata var. baccata]